MGNSASASIFFGCLIGDEGSDSDEIQKAFANSQGLNGENWRDRDKAMKDAGLEIVAEGCLSEGEYRNYVAIKSSLQYGDWCEATKIDVGKLVAQPDWREKIRTFCEAVGVDFVEPDIIMTVSYG